MKQFFLLVVFDLAAIMANATNYYVDAFSGNNSYSGLSASTAKQTIPAAAVLTNAGDTVFIMNGSYSPFTISRGGDETGRVVYSNYPGHSPRIVSTSSSYNVITVNGGTNYLTINGLDVVGYGVSLSLADTTEAQAAIACPAGATSGTVTFIPKFNGTGINIGNSTTVVTHHITISNNKIHDHAANGMGIGYCDYIIIDGNTVYNNAWYSPYGNSGISFGNSANYDNNTTTYRNYVTNNVCYGNREYVKARITCTVSDGNGIILDIPKTDYNGKSLVANNLCFNNGGSGMHSFRMNHTDMVHNTLYLNSSSPTLNNGDLYAREADDIKIYNNIIISMPGKRANNTLSSTNLVYDYNIYYGSTAIDLIGVHSLIQDPKFVNPSTDPSVANFHLLPGSFAANNGDNTHSYLLDKDGAGRPLASVVDMGAYESGIAGNLYGCSGTPQSKILGTGAGAGEGSATLVLSPMDARASAINQKSRKAIDYPTALLTANGITANTIINSLQFRRAIQISGTNTAPSTQVLPDNGILNVYLRNEATDDLGGAGFDWTTLLPGSANPALLVYGGDAASIVGNAGGWKTIPFQIPFTYTGGNLGVFVEYLQKGSISGATDINWIYEFGTSPNGFQYTGTTSAIANILSTSNQRRPVLTVGYCAVSTLPVTLTYFNAVKKGPNVQLNWTVSTEMNNAGFEVQRSKNGSNFEPIGFVNSKAVNGNSTTKNDYDYTDTKPLDIKAYYRLQKKDRDGKVTYSPIVLLNNSFKSLDLVNLYPNPVNDRVTALVSSAASRLAMITIKDLTGKKLLERKQQLPTGYSTIEMNVAKLASSIYLLVVELTTGERLISKFVKK